MNRNTNTRHGTAGFTLIEVLITVSVISILATAAVPNLVSGKSTANERTIIATLRTIANAQMQFKTLALVDQNGDGAAEHGTLSEMIGAADLRGSGERLAPTMLSLSIGDPDLNGRFKRSGYYVAIHLPDSAGIGRRESEGATVIDAELAADYWSCVAWPMEATGSKNAYFINQRGEIMLCKRSPYTGNNPPPAGAACAGVDPNRIDNQVLALDGSAGADGNVWIAIH